MNGKDRLKDRTMVQGKRPAEDLDGIHGVVGRFEDQPSKGTFIAGPVIHPRGADKVAEKFGISFFNRIQADRRQF